ncbi:MAG: Gfo/Idh/MocA family oxidoreductase [Kiritimatiellae bacterium]|nr:Gfo/Idh/MocA family oxidoreductase [Kiritimatiellia bacterium]
MINIAVVGTGYIGPVHIECLSRISGVKVVAVVDANLELARKTAARYNIEKTLEDYRDVLKDPDIHVIHNCTPNKYHYGITKEAMEKGKHVLSEKPLAMNQEEARELVEIAKKNKIVTGIDFCYRYYPVVQEMAVRIRRGELGDVRMASGSYFQDWLSKETDFSWRLQRSESGESNITADLGSHWFDLVQFATGLKVAEVIGDFASLVPVRKKPKRQVVAFEDVKETATENFKAELEDYSAVLFRLSNGAPGSFTTSQACAGRKSDTEFQVYGSTCSYAWNHKHSTELWIGYRDKPNEVLIENPVLQDASTAKYAPLPAGHPTGYYEAVMHLFQDYYDALNGNDRSAVARPTFETGYEEMKIVDAVVASNKKRQWVSV